MINTLKQMSKLHLTLYTLIQLKEQAYVQNKNTYNVEVAKSIDNLMRPDGTKVTEEESALWQDTEKKLRADLDQQKKDIESSWRTFWKLFYLKVPSVVEENHPSTKIPFKKRILLCAGDRAA